jgi:hypothetical protein
MCGQTARVPRSGSRTVKLGTRAAWLAGLIVAAGGCASFPSPHFPVREEPLAVRPGPDGQIFFSSIRE